MFSKINLFKFLRELLIVFIGVFAAFMLNDYRNNQIEKKNEKVICQIVYDDLTRYYESGNRENKDGFILAFEDFLGETEKLIQNKQLPIGIHIVGDYWNIELINSMLSSGKLNDIDPQIFQHVSRFHTIHGNMINQIDQLNKYYESQVLPNLDKGVEEFYTENGRLKIRYQKLFQYQEMILSLAELTVEMSKELGGEIRSKYLE